MPSPTWTRIVIFLAAALWVVVGLALGLDVDESWVKPLGIVTAAVVLLLLAFDVFAWKFLPLRLVKVPNLNGTWHAALKSSHTVASGEPLEMTCFLIIRQSYSRIHIEMLFPKSESLSTSAAVVQTDGTSELWYSYRSEAHALDRDDNPPHKGAVQLRIATNGTIKMAGSYWTDRKTYGRIETLARRPKVINDYDRAAQEFGVK